MAWKITEHTLIDDKAKVTAILDSVGDRTDFEASDEYAVGSIEIVVSNPMKIRMVNASGAWVGVK